MKRHAKRKPEAGSIYDKLYKCVHASGATELANMVEPFLKKKGVAMSEKFAKANGAKAKLAFTRSYVLRALKRGYLVAAG